MTAQYDQSGAPILAAVTIVSAAFVTPAAAATVDVQVELPQALIPGSVVFVEGAGGYGVVAQLSSSTVRLANLAGYPGNAAPGTPIAAGARIGPSAPAGQLTGDTWTSATGINITGQTTDVNITATLGYLVCIAGGDVQFYAAGDVFAIPGAGRAFALGPRSAAAGQGGVIRCYELSANGVNSLGWKAPDSVPISVDYDLPLSPSLRGQLLETSASGATKWGVTVQHGSATLTATGESAAIAASISATSSIVWGLATQAGAGAPSTVKYAAIAADRVNGANGTGSFKLSARDAAGALVANDTSTLNWIIIDGVSGA